MKSIRIANKITKIQNQSFKQYLSDISSIKVFTSKEEEECSLRAINGDKEAANELIIRNLRFVVSIAKQYESSSAPLEDLVNEGNIGLIIASQKYNVSTGFKFISYAVYWIRKMIFEYIAKNSKLIKIPTNKINSLSKLNKQINLLEQEYGNFINIEDIIDEFNEDMTDSEIKELKLISSMKVDSLDIPLDENESTNSLHDVIADDSFRPTDYILRDEDLKITLTSLLNTLKPRDRMVIINLYGLDGSTPMTLYEVGEKIGLTREMIRQIKEKSLKILRNNIKY